MDTPTTSAKTSLSPDQGVFFDGSRKRFQNLTSTSAGSLQIDETGTICGVTDGAKALLEYSNGQRVEGCFFSFVHSKNQYRVMRDIADMIVYGKRTAEWFIRLRTGRQRWQWYRATAQNAPSLTGTRIRINLHEAIAQ